MHLKVKYCITLALMTFEHVLKRAPSPPFSNV